MFTVFEELKGKDMTLKLKQLDPEILAVRPPVRLKILRERNDKNPFAEIRRQKILDYAKRQKQRSVTDKEQDYQNIDEWQQEWTSRRMAGPVKSWERWDGVIEVWEPWNRYGEPVNIWRYYKSR